MSEERRSESGATARPGARGWRRRAIIVTLAIAVVAVSARLSVPVPGSPVPQSLQTLAVVLVGAWLGWLWGGVTLVLYVFVGAVGVPVFAEGAAGAAHLVGPTAGYLIAFPLAALWVGWGVDSAWPRFGGTASGLERAGSRFGRAFLVMVLGHLLVLALGWLRLSNQLGSLVALEAGVLPFLWGSVAKSAVGAAVWTIWHRWRVSRGMATQLLKSTATAWLMTALLAAGASAQATGMPTFFAPTRAFVVSETGFGISRPGGGTTGLELRLGFALDEADLAVRGGYVDRSGNVDGSWVMGLEGRIPLLGRRSDFPLDGALILGVGRRFEDGGGLTIIPVGFTLGRRLVLDDDQLVLTPYAQPTLIFADGELITLGLGLDLRIAALPEIRLNLAEGDMDGFSISLFWNR